MAVKTKTIDPVCKMDVDQNSAFSSTYMGKTYYFCGEDDKKAFDMNPEKYMGGSSGGSRSSNR